MFRILITALLATVRAREVGMRAVPGVRDSIINLGKMDVSFYMNGKPEDFQHEHFQESSELMKPCTCSHGDDDEFQFSHNLLNSHSSHFQQPAFSTRCCKQKGIHDFIFAFTPKIHQVHSKSPQGIPFPLNLLMDPLAFNLPAVPKRNKAIELVLFPKRKDVETNVKTTKNMKKTKIETEIIVADEGKNFKKLDSLPVPVVQNNLDETTDKLKSDSTKNKEEKADVQNL